jgi:hypothetical protein
MSFIFFSFWFLNYYIYLFCISFYFISSFIILFFSGFYFSPYSLLMSDSNSSHHNTCENKVSIFILLLYFSFFINESFSSTFEKSVTESSFWRNHCFIKSLNMFLCVINLLVFNVSLQNIIYTKIGIILQLSKFPENTGGVISIPFKTQSPR